MSQDLAAHLSPTSRRPHQRRRGSIARFLALCALAVSAVLTPPPAAFTSEWRLDLPQVSQTVALGKEAAAALRGHFVSSLSRSDLPEQIQKILVDSLPNDFRSACGEMLESATHTAEWSVRVLSHEPKQAWLAFRCSSRAPELRDYYDERLGFILTDAGTLKLFALGPNVNDSKLYHIEFAERFPIEGATATAFRVVSSTDNPGVGVITLVNEERLVAFADTRAGFHEILSLQTAKNENDHDDVEGDYVTAYSAQVKMDRDAQNRVHAIVARFSETATGKPQRSGVLRYRWNRAAYRFEKAD